MTETTKQKPSLWFWVVAVFGLVWNAMGINHYLHQAYKTDGLKEMYPDPEVLQMVYDTPSWVMAAFATAVFFGFLGSLLLLLRNRWAYMFFIISLIGIIAQTIYNIFMSKALDIWGPAAIIMPIFVLMVGFGLLQVAKVGARRQWLK